MNETTDLKELISLYAKHWKWFVLAIMVSLAIAIVKLRYSTATYRVNAKIKILEENGEGGLNLFKDLDILSGQKNNVLDEIELIRSRSNFIEVVKKLKLNIVVFEQGDFKDSEIYGNVPINLNFIAQDSVINKTEFSFFLFLNSKNSFGLSIEEDDPIKVYSFGKNVPTPIGDMVITPNNISLSKFMGKKLNVVVTPVDLAASYFREIVEIGNEDDKSSVVQISMEDAKPEKAEKILNELIAVYNKNGLSDKKEIADRTSNFIDDRIADISNNLTSVDASAENLRTTKGITDIATETNINLQTGANNRQQLSSVQNELQIAQGMKDIIEQQGQYDILPSNIGLSDPTMASTTSKYNQLVQERSRLLKSSNEKNPVIQNLNQQLENLKESMSASLESNVNNLELTVNTLSSQNSIINSRIYSAPKNERALRDITRQQQTTESLYLYLLQKREEAQIAAASTSPKCKVVDYAHLESRKPVAPNKKKYVLAALVLGFLIPFSIIYVNDLLDNKVHNMLTLEAIRKDIPVLGELPRIGRKESKIIIKDDRTVLAESLRIIRTNLDYLIKFKQKEGKKGNVVFVTSSVPGEGKTFVSSNLAMILASTQKKVLMIGSDIRNPKIHEYFNEDEKNKEKSGKPKNNNLGLTDFLMDQSINQKQIISTKVVASNSIDIIYSGKIPPNPAELLINERMKMLLEETSKNYDYVIVDTAPLMVVTDTLLIAPYADHFIYVSRSGVTETKSIQFPIKLQEDGKINGLSFVVNDVPSTKLGYGGAYGYGYAASTTKKWWHLFIKPKAV